MPQCNGTEANYLKFYNYTLNTHGLLTLKGKCVESTKVKQLYNIMLAAIYSMIFENIKKMARKKNSGSFSIYIMFRRFKSSIISWASLIWDSGNQDACHET